MRSGPDPDVARLADRLGIETRSLRPAGGASGSAWTTGEPRRALQVGPAARIRREVAAHAAARVAVPVPAVLDVVEVEDTAAALLAWSPGRPALVAAQDDPALAGRIGTACGRLHDRLAAVPAPSGMPTAGTGAVLLHLDLHPLNVLVYDRGNVTAVLDWANAAAGDPALDRARSWSVLTLDPAARRLALHPWWRDLVEAWRSAGRLDDLGATERAWACRFLLSDLAGRHGAGAMRPARAALRAAEREISPP